MLPIYIILGIIIGLLFSKNYTPKTKKEKNLFSIFFPLGMAILIAFLITLPFINTPWFSYRLGENLVFTFPPGIAAMIVLLVKLKVSEKEEKTQIIEDNSVETKNEQSELDAIEPSQENEEVIEEREDEQNTNEKKKEKKDNPATSPSSTTKATSVNKWKLLVGVESLAILILLLCNYSNHKTTVKQDQFKALHNRHSQSFREVTFIDKIDTMSYTMGIAQSKGLRKYMVDRLNVDTIYLSEFIQGILESMTCIQKTSQSSMQTAQWEALQAGVGIGQQVITKLIPDINREAFGDDETKTINRNNFISGFIAGITEKDMPMSQSEAYETAQRLMDELHKEGLMAEYGDNMRLGQAFMDSIAKTPGVVKTKSGLCYKVITQGKGKVPAKTDRVKVNYRGTLIDDTEFDSTYKRNEPSTFRANQVIPGWTEALTMMPVGSRWILYIPQDLAYGERNQGLIKPFTTLIYYVELLDIVN